MPADKRPRGSTSLHPSVLRLLERDEFADSGFQAGQTLLNSLRTDGAACARPLPPLPLPLPQSVLEFADELPTVGVAAALRRLLGAPLGAPAAELAPYASGPSTARFAPRDAAVAAFFAALFHHVAEHGRCALAGWDLFHAHLFATIDESGEADCGLLFHAREHPREFTMSSTQIPPLGGAGDARSGTQLSVTDDGYVDRCFVWLARTNAIHLLEPQHPAFPPTLLSPYAATHFGTVSEQAFCPAAIADINYFPDPKRVTEATAGQTTPQPDGVSFAVYAPWSSPERDDAAATAEACTLEAVQAALRPRAAAAARTEHGVRWREAQVEASLRFERLLAGKAPAARRRGGLWIVLVGGESGTTMRADAKGTRPGAWLGGHCSLQNIGRAYEALCPLVGADRIIVIAQLHETLAWLEAATASAEACERVAGSARFLELLRARLADTRRDCAALIAATGGVAHHDGADVCAATVLRVLRGGDGGGDDSGGGGGSGSSGGGRVVPAEATSVLVLLNSHGNAHPRHAGAPERGHEHYLLMPHPTPEAEAKELYAGVAWAAGAAAPGSDPHPLGPTPHRWRLYGTQLLQALLSVRQRHPRRKTIVLNQSCLAAGHARFLLHQPFKDHLATHQWPVLMISTAGEFETSLGDFMRCWVDSLVHAVARPAARVTLGGVFAAAERRYHERNRGLRAQNEASPRSASVPADGVPMELTVGTPHQHGGDSREGVPMSEVAVWDLLLEEEEGSE